MFPKLIRCLTAQCLALSILAITYERIDLHGLIVSSAELLKTRKARNYYKAPALPLKFRIKNIFVMKQHLIGRIYYYLVDLTTQYSQFCKSFKSAKKPRMIRNVNRSIYQEEPVLRDTLKFRVH